jgi:glycosyltransferase involved in cell wall biosynthesis
MKLGVVNQESWIFFQEIYDYLSINYHTEVFKPEYSWFPNFVPKLNQYLLRRNLQNFLDRQDAILFEWASSLLVEASQMKTNSNAILMARLHRYEMFEWVERINWQSVSYVILDTQAMRSKLLSKTNISPDRTLVIPPVGFSEDRILKTPTSFKGNIGILSSLHPRKRIYELILAFYAVVKENPNLKLHIGGNIVPDQIDYYESLLFLTHKLGLDEKVIFYGEVSDRWKWYPMIDIFISNSYSEGMQVAPLEACACGCYCLSHFWEGADEIFDEEQLFITEDEFVEKVINYCQSSDEDRWKMGEHLRNFISQNCTSLEINKQIEGVVKLATKDLNNHFQE